MTLLAAILLLVLLFFYRDVVFLGKTFLMENMAPGTMPDGPYNYAGAAPSQFPIDPGAIAWINEPTNRFVSRSLQRGDFPLWNPYAGLVGYPVFADGVAGPLEPLQLLFHFLPEGLWPYGVDVQLLMRFWLAGFFCTLFARRLKIGLAGALSAGIILLPVLGISDTLYLIMALNLSAAGLLGFTGTSKGTGATAQRR